MKTYNCKKCNAELFWDSKAKCLKCQYCGSKYTPDELEGVIEKSPTQTRADNQTIDNNKLGTDLLVVYKCPECGGNVVTSKDAIATKCIYCGRAVSLLENVKTNMLPETIVPFEVSKKEAENIYLKYCKRTLLVPRKFKQRNEIKKMTGTYVPFWLHSFNDFFNTVVRCRNSETQRYGDDKIILHHKYDVIIDAVGDFGEIPVDGKQNLSNKLSAAIEPFDISKREYFKPAYMSGYYAETYDEDAAQTFDSALQRADDTMKKKIMKSIGSYESKKMTNYTSYPKNINSECTMLPIWLLNVVYRKKKYTYAINGQTGKICGKLPLSIPKVFLFGSGTFIISQIIALLIRLFM